MEQRLANSWRMTVNERKFIEHALLSDLRVDGRRPFDYRRLTIKFGREDGSSEVQLGQTHVMGFVTSQLVQPYRDRPNEGTLSIFTEFSPMADPSFEAGRPGEFAVELGRIIDRGLRESRAVDTESLCVLAGKLVWAIRVDLHIIDNGGNLVDAANIAALAALSTFRRPECTLGGEDGQEVIVHPHEVREPLPLIIHHLPIAVTFAFFGDGEIVVIDPTHKEEVVMGGRMTATLNTNGDVCAVQKAGGVGAMRGVIMQCMRVASVKATDITDKIRNAVEAYNLERSLRKIKRHPPLDAQKIDGADLNMSGSGDQVVAVNQDIGGSSRNSEKMLNEEDDKSYSSSENDGVDGNTGSSQVGDVNGTQKNVNLFTGGPSSWDPYSKGIAFSKFFKGSTGLPGPLTSFKEQEERSRIQNLTEPMQVEPAVDPNAVGSTPIEGSSAEQQICHNMTLRDAVKVKHRRKKNASSAKNRT